MTIWSTLVSPEADIGEDCTIGVGAWIDAGVVIGPRCKIQNNALIYRGAVLEEGVFIGPGAIITNDRWPRAIGFDNELIGPDDWTLAETTIAMGASIGAGAIVIGGVRIGAYAMVGAGSVVTHDVAPFATVKGVPAR